MQTRLRLVCISKHFFHLGLIKQLSNDTSLDNLYYLLDDMMVTIICHLCSHYILCKAPAFWVVSLNAS